MCGGTVRTRRDQGTPARLSPRVRGNRPSFPCTAPRRRSIPACAGEPPARRSVRRRLGVYPRVCGGTDDAVNNQPNGIGLSPRVRGNPDQPEYFIEHKRSIPACAGEPTLVHRNPPHTKVYPRVCGGTCVLACRCHVVKGLSPRVRGNLGYSARETTYSGSIPACAGEPEPALRPTATYQVYPRVCGGTSRWLRRFWSTGGLSPRVRGNRSGMLPTHQMPRSIPACAGEPRMRKQPYFPSRVYPRVCGGTRWKTTTHSRLRGLSPRVRGNHHFGSDCICGRRSIPACAGEPTARQGVPSRHAVYPRVCGGTRCTTRTRLDTTGLSPRVRGNPGQRP